MMSRSLLRMVTLSAALAACLGCNDDDDDDAGGSASTSISTRAGAHGDVEFFDDFSGTFPPPHWRILRGNPFTTPNVGNDAPGLALLGDGSDIRLRSTFKFSTSEAFTLSFDVAAHELDAFSRFTFRIREADGGGEASFQTRIHDGEVRLRIERADEDVDFPMSADGFYEFVELQVDSEGVATWRINGTTLMIRPGFGSGTSRIEIETTGSVRTKFVVDNVRITRP